MNIFSSFATDLAIDLGTANTCVFAHGRGVVLNEPSIVAFNTAHGHVEAVGQDAHDMLGRTPPHIRAVRQAAADDADTYSHAEAEFALWDMLLRDKNVEEATEVARRIAKRFPENGEVAAFLASRATR